MSKASSRKQQQSLTRSITTIPPNVSDDIFMEDHEEDDTGVDGVTRHIYLKYTQPTGTLDKQVVLRRIRNRKHMNMVKSAVSSLFASTTTNPRSGNSSPNKIRWVDDPFAAP